MRQFLLGYDVGSSSVKVTLLDADNGNVIGSGISPKKEMDIDSPHLGWAEQNPAGWWHHLKLATGELRQKNDFRPDEILAIGISYQMHGLVLVDRNKNILRPSIIWCDSRAVDIGEKAFRKMGEEKVLSHLLNSPGNFTASKLKWVKENEPEIYDKIDKFMLPGDYIAMKMTGLIRTTVSGLSEGIFWDYRLNGISDMVLNEYGLDVSMVPETVPTFGEQGRLTASAASELELAEGIPVTYRAGDQPNNAFSLKAVEPGEIAATAGTSGVIYAVTDKANYDLKSRVNTFVHVNHSPGIPRYGVLLCVNGTGILNSWLKNQLGHLDYPEMNQLASAIPIGSEGVRILPFGNGAERVLENKDPGAVISGLNFNRHHRGHLFRAAQEGIVFALRYGFDIMNRMEVPLKIVRAGVANMFLSDVFREAFVNTTRATLELYNTDGAQGAARAAGIGVKFYKDHEEAFSGLTIRMVIEPDREKMEKYQNEYNQWLKVLTDKLS
ncbi:MAG: carbohydrate kinase [Cyclobacteriaceae bacterium]|nr:carbohydrate kinase [Cyclobacteriaceae bacterium]